MCLLVFVCSTLPWNVNISLAVKTLHITNFPQQSVAHHSQFQCSAPPYLPMWELTVQVCFPNHQINSDRNLLIAGDTGTSLNYTNISNQQALRCPSCCSVNMAANSPALVQCQVGYHITACYDVGQSLAVTNAGDAIICTRRCMFYGGACLPSIPIVHYHEDHILYTVSIEQMSTV